MIQLDWYIPEQVLIVKLIGNVTDRDLFRNDDRLVHAMNDAQNGAVDVILDFNELTALPSITSLVKLRGAKHPNLGKVIVVGSHEPFTLTASLVAQLFRIDIVFADNLYDSYRYINTVAIQHYTDAYV